ncbi:DUF1653 domain-containing protein [Acetobacter musti]|uniref:DUF1653 domain-containing protein n=1 Tax=Acetobacter musti TaxID=864732 RepID=A0ABX0JPK4_9PROT|nr:DUF1653 domain-containing protein [Acetobacter musti]NHN84717.1 DUF1653 domain-containing protein [Acetobacter musti]
MTLQPDQDVTPGVYRHYKGGLYTVLATARHSETEEWFVVYRSESMGTLWVRPLSMWLEKVGGVPRFARLADDSQSAPCSTDGGP